MSDESHTRVSVGVSVGVCGCLWACLWVCLWVCRVHACILFSTTIPPAELVYPPSPGIGHDDSVVDGEGVVGQPSDVPSTDLDGLTKGLGQGEVRGARDLV